MKDDVSAAAAGFGPDFDDMIGGTNHRLVVLHHDHGVSRVGKLRMIAISRSMSRGCRPTLGSSNTNSVSTNEVPRQDVRLTRSHFAARKRFRRAIERQVTKPHLLEVTQARDDRVVSQVALVLPDGVSSAAAAEPPVGFSRVRRSDTGSW